MELFNVNVLIVEMAIAAVIIAAVCCFAMFHQLMKLRQEMHRRVTMDEMNAEVDSAVESVAKHYESMLEKAKQFDAWKANPYTAVLEKQIAELNNNLEVERIRLAACDVAATGYFDGYFDGCNDKYKSAALTSVLSLRERAAKLEEDLDLNITRDATINLLKQTLVKLFNGVASAPVASGICCCGDDMTRHPSAFSCGHTPVDMWDNYLSGWREEIDKLVGGMSNVQLDSDSDNGRPVQLRELDSPVPVGQLLGDGQNPSASNPEPKGTVALTDTFQGNDSSLIDSIASLIELDRKGALVPHGIGGHARALLESAAIRLKRMDRDNVTDSFWTMLQECESKAEADNSPVLKHWVASWYKQWNAMTGDNKAPRWFAPAPVMKSCGKCKHDDSCADSGRHKNCLIGNELRLFEAKEAPALCEDEGCPHRGTPHVCVTPEKGVFQPTVVWYYPDDGGKVIPASLDFLNERREATGKAVPISDYKLAVELTAKYIYSGWKDQEGYKEWVENGNSNKQEEARQFARVRLSTVAKSDCCEGGPQWGHAWNCPKLP